ncbi:helix-turn-helix domain-containing protein [Candidatus Chloroploca sp. M-50]|uniref:Helix-turn-helix domain-containing protein n=1 Tax=Candidatus Chloroploca mongolica TaxID=2528176 RepID=A0ABS4DF94_9CHLR|nr:helix-turn-helix domain-containing protein [Candidatus Chloroploca mongolica]MBP1468113.1 helix-turn-helix domain-containing protein [Candidatus Chloroploca mongolica]
MSPPERFNQAMRRLRRSRGVTQRELSQRAFCSLDTVKKLETGARQPSRHLAEQIATVLALVGDERDAFLALVGTRSPLSNEASSTPLITPAPQPSPIGPFSNIPLLGRKAELAALQDLLADPQVRLLTILGPGGSGKSRLALALAKEVIGHYADGISLVPLAPVTDAALLPQAIAVALGVGLAPEPDPGTQVLAWLHHRQLLLVLDNIEQLRAATPWLQELLVTAPGVQLLVTSRERLHLPAEWVFDLHGLAVPPPGGTTFVQDQAATLDHRYRDAVDRPDLTSRLPLPSLEDWPAVALFTHWARRTRAGAPISPEELPAIAAICRLVEGLPLAIELAASWVRTLSPAEIARELARGIDLLAAAAPTVTGRHASMRVVFAHSWQLLTEHERVALERCAVFRGGFTAEQAVAVADAPLPMLATLIDKTLLRRGSAGRYELHELARQYAEEQLARRKELAATRDRHLAMMIALAEAGDRGLRGHEQFAWYQRLAAEEDNLRAALDWATESGQAAVGLQLAGACGLFWLMRSHILEGFQPLREAGAPRVCAAGNKR